MKTADLTTKDAPKSKTSIKKKCPPGCSCQTAPRAIKFLLAYMRKQGATSRAKSISYEKIEESHLLNMGKPGFGYHSYAGYYTDGVPVEELLQLAKEQGLVAGRWRNEEEPHLFDNYYVRT